MHQIIKYHKEINSPWKSDSSSLKWRLLLLSLYMNILIINDLEIFCLIFDKQINKFSLNMKVKLGETFSLFNMFVFFLQPGQPPPVFTDSVIPDHVICYEGTECTVPLSLHGNKNISKRFFSTLLCKIFVKNMSLS